MARPKRLLTAEDIEKLQSLTRGDNMAAVGYRLAAVRAYIKRSANEVASFFGTKPETVIRWASNFHRYGIQGLENKNRGHRRMKLTAEIQDEVRKWLEDDTDHAGHPVHWTGNQVGLFCRNIHRSHGKYAQENRHGTKKTAAHTLQLLEGSPRGIQKKIYQA